MGCGGSTDSPTEEANPKSANLDRLSAREIVELFVAEEKSVEEGLRQCVNQIGPGDRIVGQCDWQWRAHLLRGRRNEWQARCLDAAEIPPTFGASADLFQGIIAGARPRCGEA